MYQRMLSGRSSLLRGSVLLGTGLLCTVGNPITAEAAILNFGVEVEIDGASVTGQDGRALGLEFSYFANGQGTYNSDTGTLSIMTEGLSCQGGSGGSCGASYAYGTHGPWSNGGVGYLALGSAEGSVLDITLNNPSAVPTEGDLSGLRYGAQDVGTLSVPIDGSPAWVPPIATVSIMESPTFGYAAAILPTTENGVLEFASWLIFSEGIFGSTASHVESQTGEAQVNAAIRILFDHDGKYPENEVPEPLSAVLLGSGLLGLAARRKQEKIK